MASLVVHVDVDDTLARTAGTKRIPMVEVVEHVRALAASGAMLYCWSSGGGEYAQATAEELGIANCFVGFLPKPHVIIDDQQVGDWRQLVQVHPLQCVGAAATRYRTATASNAIDSTQPAEDC